MQGDGGGMKGGLLGHAHYPPQPQAHARKPKATTSKYQLMNCCSFSIAVPNVSCATHLAATTSAVTSLSLMAFRSRDIRGACSASESLSERPGSELLMETKEASEWIDESWESLCRRAPGTLVNGVKDGDKFKWSKVGLWSSSESNPFLFVKRVLRALRLMPRFRALVGPLGPWGPTGWAPTLLLRKRLGI